jgi:hypothetical protein
MTETSVNRNVAFCASCKGHMKLLTTDKDYNKKSITLLLGSLFVKLSAFK